MNVLYYRHISLFNLCWNKRTRKHKGKKEKKRQKPEQANPRLCSFSWLWERSWWQIPTLMLLGWVSFWAGIRFRLDYIKYEAKQHDFHLWSRLFGDCKLCRKWIIFCRWNIKFPAIIQNSISILSSGGLGMSMFSLGKITVLVLAFVHIHHSWP